jgi:hypothetical protein
MGQLAMPNGDTIDIEPAPAEKAYHPIEDTGLILNNSN